MSLLPDPADLRAIADRIAAHATGTRSRAHALGRATAESPWRGTAADVFGTSAAEVIGELRRAAARLDDAADALRRHADRIGEASALTLVEHEITHGVLSGAVGGALSLLGL
ncbi:MAG TPA: hypothetical protein VGN18_13990 [Jatrophihabitans sp.]|jgi:hypothetical protein|uniref:hypothetical protein n=1 Tax=Jatrophihabitans sp. TaxID=1932789 RepID=UPI002E072895|nr:hypothetical protein [Jatrophihabitans sp.]